MRARTRVVSNVTDHGSFLLFDHQAQQIEGIRLDDAGPDGDDEIWLSVPHPPGPEVPPRADSPWLAPWLNVGAALLVAPQLATEVEGAALISSGTHRDAGRHAANVAEAADPVVEPKSRVRLAEYPFAAEVRKQHARYLETVWRPWAEVEQRRRRLAQLYVKLFTLQQELSGALVEGQLELVWGMGLAISRQEGKTLAYPLLTRAVDLVFDPHTRAAEVRPREADPKLELEFFVATERPGAPQAEKAAEAFLADATAPLSPFDPASYQPLLDIVRQHLSDESGIEFKPAWVLFARQRSAGVAVQDLERFRRVLGDLAEDAPLPAAVSALVTEPAHDVAALALPAFRGVSAAYHENGAASRDSAAGGARDLFFPKPFNDEQARIVQLLEASDGVAVQGPPGTGKTHTIANIICHWLANGRRVLVTSMRDPALDVLRDQLPEEIRPLAISLLAADYDGGKAFERSIEKIASEVQGLDRDALAREIVRLEETVDALHARIVRIDVDLGRWAKLNLSRIELEGESIDPQDAAAEVVQDAGKSEWIPDPLGIGPQYAPRFAAEDVARLREARSRLGADIALAAGILPAPADFPETARIAQAHEELQRFTRLVEESRLRDVPWLADSNAATVAEARELSAQLANFKEQRGAFAKARPPWSDEAIARMKRGEPAQLLEVLEALGRDLEETTVQRTRFLERPVALPEAAEIDADFLQAATNLSRGRRAFPLSALFGKSAARKLLAAVRVSGAPPAGAEDWKHVLAWLALQKRRRELTARWNAMAPEIGFQSVLAADAKGRLSPESQLATYRRLRALAHEETALARRAAKLFPAWDRAAAVGDDPQALEDLEKALAHHLNRQWLADAYLVLDDIHRVLEGRSGRLFEDMRGFVARVMGNPSVDESRLLAAWSGFMGELARLNVSAGPLQTVAEISARIAASGAPRLAELLRKPAQSGEDKLPPDTLLRDWRLRRLAGHLQAIDSQQDFKKLSDLRAGFEHDLARAYRDLVVKRTWLKLAENVTPSVRAALQAYLNAIQRIGKGTGKRAWRYRQDARFAAAEAQRAVPCWIMPHYRVSESLPSELGCFDLVVIDEASQSDLTALPVLLRAKKLLVVGDDKQVSPQAIGMEEERIKALMQRHLSEQVPLYRAQMSPDRSIYDLAKVVFARTGVMLREHFRCVAPIIEYSKREFYNHELRPLRLPRTSERLDPPLLDIFMENGRRENDVNPAEAEFIVGEIASLVEDPRMRRLSIGVVSLLGEEQALRIWDRLTERLGPDLMRRHAITCGDARMFQGRERDVMYLSMVSAPNDVGAPLSRDTFAQRFNVAASRARDRMVLVRSVELHHLSESDRLRRGLITHFAKPFGDEPARVTDLRELCESPLERELFDWLNAKGYRVTPQVRVGTYRIDLVVEGRDDARLAVECDGDKYHGPEQWVEDMRRQRALERAGWVFWRCFAATLLRRRQAVLDDLRSALSAQGIEPVGAGGWGRRRMTETRRVVHAAQPARAA